MPKLKLTVICPVYNEEAAVPLFFARFQLTRERLQVDLDVDLIFTNNASTDGTMTKIEAIRQQHNDVFVISLSRNVGYQRSIECGLRNAKGDYFLIIDVDCEDPPELIIDLMTKLREGYDIVYGERVDREESEWIQALRKLFYRIMRSMADENIILDMAEFALMTAEVRDAIVEDQTSFPFIRASIGRVGFRTIGIPYKRQKRIAGETHYNFVQMTIFAIAGILSSSTLLLRLPVYILPLWVALVIGLAIASAGAAADWAIPALIAVIGLYIGGTLAFIGIYVARVYKNTLGRPNFVIRREGTYLQS